MKELDYFLNNIDDDNKEDKLMYVRNFLIPVKSPSAEPITDSIGHALIEARFKAEGFKNAEELASKYLKFKEGDGQGYITLPEYREFMIRLGQLWSPSMEATYKRLMNGQSVSPDALKDIIPSCRTRGKLHMKSTHGLATPINLTDIVVREITLYSSRCGPFEKAIDGLKSGKIKVQELISKKFSLNKIKDAFASYEESRDHIKTLIFI